MVAKPNHGILGKRLKGAFKPVTAAIMKLTDDELTEMKAAGSRNILGHDIRFDELYTSYEVNSDSGSYSAASLNNVLVLLDCTTDQEMMDEGYAREVINRIQKLRKEAHLVPTDKISVYYKFDGKSKDNEDMLRVVQNYKEFVETAVKSPFSGTPAPENIIYSKEVEVKGCKFVLTLCGDVQKKGGVVTQWPAGRPAGDYLTVNYKDASREVLIKPGGEQLTTDRLEREVKAMFGLFGRTVLLSQNGEKLKMSTSDLSHLAGKKIEVVSN